MSLASAPSNNPVFVVGVFRSGTSLLYALLNQHPQIALMYECDVLDFPGWFAARRFRGEWLERQEFYNQALSRHRLILSGSLRGLEAIRTPDDLYRCHGETKGARLWGEKSPLYTVRLRQLARRYPNASFIVIWRDPVEIYRSIQVAGKRSAFFRQAGMLYRLIYHQERMVHDAAQLECVGTRIHHVSYDDLVDRTSDVCRNVCYFLRIGFDPEMVGLNRADLSAVYQAPQHDYLRRGVIERQALPHQAVKSATAQKLARFRKRWERLYGRTLGINSPLLKTNEPLITELYYHKSIGAVLQAADTCKRLSFEFLPLPWLRTYRLFKNWLIERDVKSNRPSPVAQIRQHGITILASFLVLGIIAGFDYFTGPEVSIGPLYLVPCAALALIVSRGWATVAAVLCAVAVTAFRGEMAPPFHLLFKASVFWNMIMRFIFFEIFVLLLDRIRRDLESKANQHPSTTMKD